MATDPVMDTAANGSEPTSASPRPVARRLLAIGENRLELLMLEVQEERERILRAILFALGVGVFGFLTGAGLTVAIVVWLWDYSPVTVLLILTAFYAAAALYFYRRFSQLQRGWKAFPATLDQLAKDRACLETLLK
jgi:uncharacterized membrane protein YqjE